MNRLRQASDGARTAILPPVGALGSVAIGVGFFVALVAYAALYLLLLAPLGLWMGYRAREASDNRLVRGVAIAGVVMNGLGSLVLLIGLLGTLIEFMKNALL